MKRNRVCRTVFSVVLSCLGAFLTGCASGHPSAGTVQITSSNPGLTAGASTQLQAIDTTLLNGVSDITDKASWTSSNPAVATVTSTGLLIGNTAGSAIITAAYNEATGSLAVAIGSPQITGLGIAPANVSVVAGASEQYTATGSFANHTTADVTSSTKWSVVPASVATISSSGLLTAVASGSFVVTGVSGTQTVNQTATAAGTVTGAQLTSLAITPANASVAGGSTQQFTATGTYNNKSTADISSSVTWTSSNTSLLTVSSTGLGTAMGNNPATTVQVTATSGAITATVPVIVTAGAKVTQLVVLPTSSSIATGSAETHTATAYYSDGTQQDVTNQVTWTSTETSTTSSAEPGGVHADSTSVHPRDTGVVTFAPGGVDVAGTPGTASVQATFGTAQSNATVIVTPATVKSLAIRASRALFPIGASQQVQLIGIFSDGTMQDLSLTANWQSSNTAVSTIDDTGLATGVSAGPVVFSASFGGLTASTVGFQVLPGDLISVLTTVDRPTIAVSTAQQPHLYGTYSSGITHDLTAVATFTSSNPAVLPIDADGNSYALSAGTTEVTGSFGGLSSVAQVFASNLVVESIDVLPAHTIFALGTTQPMVALGHYNNGAVVDISKLATWTSEDPSILTIDVNGRAKPGKIGVTRVTATRLGVTQESNDITVTAATPIYLFVVQAGVFPPGQPPTSFTIAAQTGQHLAAYAVLSDGSLQDVSQDVIWSTGDNTIASIDTTGYATEIKPGVTEVTATFGGLTRSVSLTVTSATLTGVDLTPGNSTVPSGVSQDFKLTGTFSDGTTQDLSQDAVWLAPTPTIANVQAGGLVIAQSPGVGSATANYGYFSASTPITVNTAKLVSMALTPANSDLRQHSLQQFVNTGTFTNGQQLNLAIGTIFASVTPTIAQILPSGLSGSRSVGTTEITASYQGQNTSTNLTVSSDTLTSLAVSPANPTLAAGSTQQFKAIGSFDDGTMEDVSVTTTWTSSDTTLLTINANGYATAASPAAPAQVTVTAAYFDTASAVTTNASTTVTVQQVNPPGVLTGITVTPLRGKIAAGTTLQLTANGSYTNGNTVNINKSAIWTSTNPATAVVSNTGLVTAVAPGLVSIQATSGSFMSSSLVTVSSATLQSLAITPSGASFAVGATQQFTLTATFSDGSTQDVSSVATWKPTNPDIASISSTGLATGIATGLVRFTAAFAGQTATSDTATVTAPGVTVTSLVVEPTSSSIATGTAEQQTATAYFSDGTREDVTGDVVWASASAAIATVNQDGRNVAVAAGLTNLVASLPASSSSLSSSFRAQAAPGRARPLDSSAPVQATSVVIVTSATVSSLSIHATHSIFPVGTIQPVQLIGTFSDGTSQDLSLTANWQSSSPAVATIDSTGLATGVSAGDVTFSASFGGLTASTTGYQVNASDLIALTVTIPYPIGAVGLTQQASVIGTFEDGTTHDLTEQATWSSSSPSTYPIDGSGVAFAFSAGPAVLTGSVNGFSAIINVLAVPVALASIDIEPMHTAFAQGTTQQMVANGTYANTFSTDISRIAVWTSEDPTVLTIDGNGVAKAGQVGTTRVTATYDGITQESQDIQVTGATPVTLRLLPSGPVSYPPAMPLQIGASTGKHFSAYAIFSDGSLQDVSNSVTWSTTDGTVASIDTTGYAIGSKPGQIRVSATLGSLTDSLPLTVTSAKLQSVFLTPGNAEIPSLFSRQYSMTGNFDDGSTQDLTADAIWISPTPLIAGARANGYVLGLTAGEGQISGQYGYFSASTPVVVTSAQLVSNAITPANANKREGDVLQYVNTGTFSDGLQLNLSIGSFFSSGTPSVADVLLSGAAYPSTVGTAQISATYSGSAVSTPLTVTSGTISSLVINPANPTLTSGATQQLTVTATFADGTTADVSAGDFRDGAVVWSSSNPALLTVSSAGLATAGMVMSSSIVTVTATLGGSSATATVTLETIGGGGGGTASLTSINVTPTSGRIAKGTTQQLTATGTYSDGSTANITNAVTWTSTDPTIATVSAQGLVTAINAGTVSIDTSAGSFTSSGTILVSAATLQSLAISPSGASFADQANQQFTLTGTFTDGSMQNLTAAASWTSSNPMVASIGASTGIATGVSPGSVQFTASYNGQSVTSSTATVTPATLVSIAVSPSNLTLAKGTSQQLTVIGTYSDGATRDLTGSSTFSSSNPSVLGAGSGGLVTGAGTGSATITITSGGVTFTTQPVNVTPAALVSIAITPMTPSLANGTSQQFTATGTFSDGTTQNLSSQAVWTSSNPQVATIDANGNATGDGVGNVQISATFNGITGTTGTVQVTPATLTGLVLSPTSVQIAKGTTQRFTATGVFTDGSSQNLSSQVTWSSSNGAVVGVDGTGLATGTGVGTAQVTAAYLGKSASTSSFTVTPATLVSISFVPADPTVAAGTGAQIEVIGTYSDGTTQDLTSSATLSSSNTLVATTSSDGTVNGVTPGTSVITVQAGGQTSSFNITVSAAVLTSLAITPASPSAIPLGTTEQFTATGTFSDGTMQNLSSSASWSSSSTSVATVTPDGLASGVGLGTVTISATFEGQTATTPSFSVTPATVASITVSPQNPSVVVGSTQQFTATANYTNNTTQDVSGSVTWSSSSPAVASISASGLASAASAGSTGITAQLNTLSGSSTLTVTSAPPPTLEQVVVTPASGSSIHVGSTAQFTATGMYSDGSTQNLTLQATWTSSAVNVATVNSSGLATGVAAGSVTVQAAYGGQTGSAPLTVTTAPVTLQSIAVTPASATIVTGGTQQFTATGTYSDSSTQNLTAQVTWTSSNNAEATINASGLATGVVPGNPLITAQLASTTGTASLIVTIPPPALNSITVTPATDSIIKNATVQYTATGNYADGSTQNLTSQVTWTSSNGAVATISSAGLATGVAAGSSTIQAALNGSNGTGTLTVTVPTATLQSITVTPPTASIATTGTQPFTATGNYSDSTTQNLTSLVTWTSSNNAEALINASGVATGVVPGTVTISAAYAGVTGTASLTVTLGAATLQSIAVTPTNASILTGGTQQYTATGTYSDNSTQNLTTQVTWSSSSAATATISSAGLATGVAAGNSTITAALNSTSGTATLTVTAAPPPVTLQSIAVTPASASIQTGATQQYTATGTYSDNSTQNLTTQVTWSSSSAATATISSAGLATGVAAGNSTITAMLNSTSGTAALTVTNQPVTLQSIAVTPATASILTGATQQYTATGTYSDHSTQNLTTQVTWSSSNAGTATINSAGLATGVAAGSATITATLNGTSGTAALTVTNPPVTLQSIAVTPASMMLASSATQQYTATGTYSDSSTQDLTTQVTWSSSVPTIASINSAGLATALSPGTTQIGAALSGQTGTATLTVSPAALTSLAVTPATATVAAGTGQQYKAVGSFADGSTQDLTTMVTWSSSNTTEATINASGLASTTATGTVTITATSGTVTGTATLTISTATPTGLQVTPSSVSGLPAGDVQQLMATATFTDGSSQNVTSSVAWSSSNPAVATVNSNGLLTAVGPGSAVISATLGGTTATVPVSISSATLTSITVTPVNPTIPSGQSQQLTATGTYSDGSTQNLTNAVTWTSSDPTGIPINSTGNIMVMAVESVTITAAHAGVSGTDTVTGSAAVVTGISVSPASTTLAVGQTQQFAATATYSDGSQQTATASAHWSVSDATKATIANGSSAGLLTANAAGSLNALATINGISGSASVTVTAATLSSLTINPSALSSLPAGTTKQLSVTATYSDGSSADVTNQVTWTTGQASTAFVDTTGLLHAVASGVTTIDAHLSGVDGTAVVTVGNATLSSIAITPAAPTLALGQTVQMTATGTYSDGSTANITAQVQWASGARAVATISSTGLVSTLTTGASTLTATLNGTTASTLLTVTSATLQSISVTSAQGSFALGQSLPLTATGFYSDGSTQNLTNSVTWTSSAPTVGVVSSTGIATGVSAGTFNAHATSNGITGSESIIVTNAVLTSIAVTPNGEVIVDLQGTTVQFTATGTFSNGTTQNLTNSVHWATTGVVVGSISQAGVFSPTGIGLGTVTATSGTITGSAQLTVVSAPLL